MEINKIHLGDAYSLIKQVPSKSVDRLNGITKRQRDAGIEQLRLF